MRVPASAQGLCLPVQINLICGAGPEPDDISKAIQNGGAARASEVLG